MNKNDWAALIFIALCGLFMFVCCGNNDSDEDLGSFGYRSSYWYDTPEVSKQKADDTLRKYYNVDEDGHITGKKEGTIVNGRPYKEED